MTVGKEELVLTLGNAANVGAVIDALVALDTSELSFTLAKVDAANFTITQKGTGSTAAADFKRSTGTDDLA